jgi:Flp pilus assembly pilin Flp
MSSGKALLTLVKDESGQDLIEYALVAALIALGAVVSLCQCELCEERSAPGG